jgi:hypothetical protein
MYCSSMLYSTSCNSEACTPFIEPISRGFLISGLSRKGMSRCFAMSVESRTVGISIMEYCRRRFWNALRHIKQLTMRWVRGPAGAVLVSCIKNRFRAISGDGKRGSSAIHASNQSVSGVTPVRCGRRGGCIELILTKRPHIHSVSSLNSRNN